jgi:hypothetical protein
LVGTPDHAVRLKGLARSLVARSKSHQLVLVNYSVCPVREPRIWSKGGVRLRITVSTVFIDFPAGAGTVLARSSTQRSRPHGSRTRAWTKQPVNERRGISSPAVMRSRRVAVGDRCPVQNLRHPPKSPANCPGQARLSRSKKVVDNSVNAAV